MPIAYQRESREKYLLRLICAKFSKLFSEGSEPLSRVVIDGVDAFLSNLFWGRYSEINSGLRFVFNDLKGCNDTDIWRQIFADPYRYCIALTVLMRTLFYFENFNRHKAAFIARVNTLTQRQSILFDTHHFDALFAALYEDLFAYLEDEGRARDFEVIFGFGTTRKIEKIRQEFLLSRRPTMSPHSDSHPPMAIEK
jgi:hypothetical protein